MSAEKSPKPGQKKRPVLLTMVNRVQKDPSWFIEQGCKQVPLEHSKNYVRWGHPDGYFLRPDGQVAKYNFSPSKYKHRGGSSYPQLRECVNDCHILMAYAFYGERPTYTDAKGQVKPCQTHHLNGDKFDYRPANLLAWLTKTEHAIADKRQKAIKAVVPNGNLHLFSYERLRELQDPRTMSDEDFEKELEAIRKKGFHTDPSIDEKEPLKYADWYED